MTCFGHETFGPVISVYRFHDEGEAVDRANDGQYGLNASIYSRDGARARDIAHRIKCGTVNINEAFGATFASIDSPMGGMRESGLGRRQGAEGIHRYTESQSVATQRAHAVRADVRHVRRARTPRSMTAHPEGDEEAGPGMTALRRPRHRVRLRRLGHRAAAHREGLPGRRARGRGAVRRRGLPGHLLRHQAVPVPTRGRAVRHPAHRRAARTASSCPAPAWAAGRWSTPTRSTSRCRPSTRDPQWRDITDWRAELAPYYDQAKRMLGVVENPLHTPSDEVMKQVAEEMGVGDTFHPTPVGVFFGGPGQPVAPRRAGPVLRRRRARPQPVPATAASA